MLVCLNTSIRDYEGGEDGGDGGGYGYGMPKCSKKMCCPWMSYCCCCCESRWCSPRMCCWKSVCHTEGVLISSISCWRLTFSEAEGSERGKAGAEVDTRQSRRQRWPRNRSEKSGSWSTKTTSLSGQSSLGARKVYLLSEIITETPLCQSNLRH